MAARLFDNGCLTPEQLSALAAKQIQQNSVVNTTCSSPNLNTCERSFEDVIVESPLYEMSIATSRKWGNIQFSWGFSNTLSDEKWGVANYTNQYAYLSGDTATVIEDGGYLVVVYRALTNISVQPGVFNPLLWEKVCEIRVSEKVGILTYNELLSKYQYYAIGETYQSSEIVLYDQACGNITCIYAATSTSTSDPGTPPSAYWKKLYCVENGKQNKCENIKKCPSGTYQIISLSSGNNDLICAPVESNLGIAPGES